MSEYNLQKMKLSWIIIFKVLLASNYTLAKTVTIKWNIMWDDTATIPTTTAVNKGGLIVGMVSTFIAVIVAVVVPGVVG
ncbi:hypothetical protein EB796_012222 [Bugula neritina]|uniref:Uncharacterized protein n=1 Tax=Bugula neritina TaxID=10212 RepID=A0A7J7JU58_BUGNE|nr:hypothetical protein EB796_012222 [Bugula neritina]